MEKDVILTGIPRSGTTLACLLLSQLPNFVALNEPMRTATYRSYPAALAGVPEFYRDTRRSLLDRGVAVARAVDGKMTDNHFSNDRGERKKLVTKQEIRIDKELDRNFRLGVKHNALFTILLDDLVKEYPVFAFVRNPLSVLGSWNSLDLPASRGEVRAAKWLYPPLSEELERIPDRHDRQLHILHWYFDRYRSLPTGTVIRYEDIVATNGHTLAVIDPSAKLLTDSLDSRNQNKVYDRELSARLAERLLDRPDHACWSFYERTAVEKMI